MGQHDGHVGKRRGMAPTDHPPLNETGRPLAGGAAAAAVARPAVLPESVGVFCGRAPAVETSGIGLTAEDTVVLWRAWRLQLHGTYLQVLR